MTPDLIAALVSTEDEDLQVFVTRNVRLQSLVELIIPFQTKDFTLLAEECPRPDVVTWSRHVLQR